MVRIEWFQQRTQSLLIHLFPSTLMLNNAGKYFIFFNEGTQIQIAAPKSCIRSSSLLSMVNWWLIAIIDLLIFFYIEVRCLSFELRTSITLQASTRMLSHYYALYESFICHACCDLARFLILCTLFGTWVKLSLNSWTIRILSQAFHNLMDGKI